MTPRGRAILLSATLLAGSLLFAALAGEIALRLFRPFEEKRRMYMRGRNVFQYDLNNIQFDEEVGFFHRSNLSVPFDNWEFHTRVLTNSIGYRDDEASLRDPKVLLLGDSFAFGWGVNKEEDLEDRLERTLGVGVLNMAVAGYGTTQEYLLLRRWCRDHPMQGKAVVFQFYGNDLPAIDKSPGGVFPALLGDSAQVSFSSATPQALTEMLDRSHKAMSHGLARRSYLADLSLQFYTRIRSKLERMRGSQASGRSESSEEAQEGGAPAQPGRALRLILGEIRALAAKQGFRVVFLYVPSVRFYEGNRDDDARTFNTISPALSQAGIPLLDLREVLSRGDYYKYDDHWRPSGHEKAARALGAFLSQNEPATPADHRR